MEYSIYAIENTSNGMCYVGRTRNVAQRWLTHKGRRDCRYLVSKAIKEFGLEKFTFRILDIANTPQEATAKERLYVHLLEANDPRFGYNNPYLYRVDMAERHIDKWLNRVRG